MKSKPRQTKKCPEQVPADDVIANQWREIEEWYRYSQEHHDDDRPVLNSLNQSWEIMAENGGLSDEEAGRGEKCRAADTPFATLFYFVEMGFYPPPELLLGLHDTWHRYLEAQGKLSMEEAFFGSPRKGLGNYAARRTSRFRLMFMRWEFDTLLRKGLSRSAAAENLAERMGGRPDADSILRMMRGFSDLFAKHSSSPRPPPEK